MISISGFDAPVLDNNTKELYTKLYGDAGERFVDILNSSPDEIAVISILIAYLKDRKGGEQHGYAENG